MVLAIACGWCLLVATAPSRAQEFRDQVVVSQEGHASDAGASILKAGGNAVDAAVATALALAVTHPAAGNLGGGGFIVAYDAATKKVLTFDFREAAPQASEPRMYLDAEGKIVPRYRAGPRAAGVPGTPRGLELAHQRLGSRPWAELVEPALRLAREGFAVSGTLARSLNAQLQGPAAEPVADENLGPLSERLADFPASRHAYSKPDGTTWKEGDRLIQPDLAWTLQRLRDHGVKDFYQGEVAAKIVKFMSTDSGLITAQDLASYEARERPPVQASFRGFEVYGMGPPSSGGIVVGQALNILGRYDLRSLGADSPKALHLITEAMKRAYATRARWIGDPDFVTVPVESLVSRRTADELAASIGDRATPSREIAKSQAIDLIEGTQTTHLSVVDRSGSAVALTYTLEQAYGSKAVVPGAGFLLNNEMGDFNVVPGETTETGRIGTAANRISGRKRMLSSMSPTLALHDGRVAIVTGSPGGRTIPNTVLWVLLRLIEFQQSPRAALDAPRTHHPWFPDELLLEGERWQPDLVDALESLGHKVRRGGLQGDAHTIVRDFDRGVWIGLPDRRRNTSRASGQ